MLKTQTQPSHNFAKFETNLKSNSRCETDNGQLEELEKESGRLKTFDSSWNNDKIRPEKLAKAGFYFLKKGDAVKCPFCKVEGCQWESDDDPMMDHKKWAPNCRFVREMMEGLPSSSSASSSNSIDVCGNQEYLPNSRPEDDSFKFLEKIGVEKTKPCSYEQFNNIEARLKSFTDWPKSLKQKPDKLAEAGFFYKGVGDQTLCFHCGGGLKDWEDDDDPWEQHACWFPSCNYLLLSKGREYVEQVQNKFDPTYNNSTKEKDVEPKKSELELELTQPVKDLPPDNRLCKICYKNELGVVFIPCGHVVACVDCTMSLKNVCPVCRKRFDSVVRAFLQ